MMDDWPAKLKVRNTGVFDDDTGKRIFSTSLRLGYPTMDYVRRDIRVAEVTAADALTKLVEFLEAAKDNIYHLDADMVDKLRKLIHGKHLFVNPSKEYPMYQECKICGMPKGMSDSKCLGDPYVT